MHIKSPNNNDDIVLNQMDQIWIINTTRPYLMYDLCKMLCFWLKNGFTSKSDELVTKGISFIYINHHVNFKKLLIIQGI